MARKKAKGTELSVFKGREAKLNRAIFRILALKGPQTIYSIHKCVIKYQDLKYARYSSVNKRIRVLEELAFLNKSGIKETKAGFKTTLYELKARTYLALLFDVISLDDIIQQIDENTALTLLALFLQISKSTASSDRHFHNDTHNYFP